MGFAPELRAWAVVCGGQSWDGVFGCLPNSGNDKKLSSLENKAVKGGEAQGD